METVVTVAVIIAMIAVGVLVIHRLNAQHGARISPEHHGDFPPSRRPHHHAWGRGRPHRTQRVSPPQDRRV